MRSPWLTTSDSNETSLSCSAGPATAASAGKDQVVLSSQIQGVLGAELRWVLSSWACRTPLKLLELSHRVHSPTPQKIELPAMDEPFGWVERSVFDPAAIAILDRAVEQAWVDLQVMHHPATKETLARHVLALAGTHREASLLAAYAILDTVRDRPPEPGK
jgi:hypothetical protein